MARSRVDRVRSVLAPLMKNRLRGSLRERVEGGGSPGGPGARKRDRFEDAEIFLDELERLKRRARSSRRARGQIDRRLYAQPDVKATKSRSRS